MAAFTDRAGVADYLTDRELRDGTGSLQQVQATLLDELPGLAFAIITMVWIVTSFAQLA
jgi:hypothetical protein